MTPVEPDAVKPDAEPELPRNRDRDLPKREGDGFRETEEQGGGPHRGRARAVSGRAARLEANNGRLTVRQAQGGMASPIMLEPFAAKTGEDDMQALDDHDRVQTDREGAFERAQDTANRTAARQDADKVWPAALSRILVPTDFSDASDAALAYGKMLAERFGASLHVVHVIEQPVIAGGLDIYATELPRILEAAQREAETRLSRLLTDTERDQFRASTEVTDGPTARTIVAIAERDGADLIVMGTHGRGGVAQLLLGSVAEKVVRMASCPVLTLRTSR